MGRSADDSRLRRFAGHGAGEEQHGAAEHQGVENEIQADDAGAVRDSDGHVNDQLHEKYGQADPRGGGARFLP